MKKNIFPLILSLVLVTGSAFANFNNQNAPFKKGVSKAIINTDKNATKKLWESTPEGIKFKKWEASPAGKKVYAGEAKIRKSLKEFTNMEAAVTSLSLPPGSKLGYGVMVRIKGEEYILAFGPDSKNEFKQLRTLKVNDKIVIRSRSVSHAPKYAFPIIAGDQIERDNKLLYIRPPNKGGC